MGKGEELNSFFPFDRFAISHISHKLFAHAKKGFEGIFFASKY